MANAKTPDGGSDLNFDELFAGEQAQKPAAKPQAGGENLQELEAFLDDFEKNLGEPKAAPPAEPAPPAAPAPAPAEPAPSFAEPHQAEELVHGLLKEDELDLDVQAAAPQEAVEFEPQPLRSEPLDIPAFIHAAPAGNGKPVPAAAAGFSRIGFILALVLGGVALLVAIGAGWMALNATQAVQGVEMRVGGGPGAQDPRIAKLQNDVTALRRQVDDLAKNLEGPVTDLQGRVATLEKVAGIVPAPVSPGTAPTPPAAAPAAPQKPEAPKAAAPAARTAPPLPEPPKAQAPAQPPASKPAPAGEAAKPQQAPTKAPAPAAEAPKPAAPVQSPKAAAPAAAGAQPPKAAAPEAPKNSAAPAAGAAAPAPQAAASAPATASPAPAAKTAPLAKSKPAPKGDWMVHLTSSDEKKMAQAQLDHARAKGLHARLTTGTVEGRKWYRVTVEGFATPEEARAYVAKQALAAGFSAAWIAKK